MSFYGCYIIQKNQGLIVRLMVSLIKNLRIGSKVNSGKFLLAFKRNIPGPGSCKSQQLPKSVQIEGVGSNAFKVA